MSCCGGNCAQCSGCGRELVLTEKEILFLLDLGQYSFLPVIRTAADPAPIYPEAPEGEGEAFSLLLQCLEKKGLVSVDYDKPLKGYAYPAGVPLPLRGSLSLTERGYQALDLLEYQGFSREIEG